MVGKTFSSRPARALRSKGFSALSICATVLPFRKTRCAVCAFSSFASAMQRLRLSGFMPINVPVNVFPIVVETLTVLSTNAATSVWNFLSATDNFVSSVIAYEIAFQLFIFDTGEGVYFPFRRF